MFQVTKVLVGHFKVRTLILKTFTRRHRLGKSISNMQVVSCDQRGPSWAAGLYTRISQPEHIVYILVYLFRALVFRKMCVISP